jgi:hypothetical protein
LRNEGLLKDAAQQRQSNSQADLLNAYSNLRWEECQEGNQQQRRTTALEFTEASSTARDWIGITMQFSLKELPLVRLNVNHLNNSRTAALA